MEDLRDASDPHRVPAPSDHKWLTDGQITVRFMAAMEAGVNIDATYRHNCTGRAYRVEAIALNDATLSPVVVYRSLDTFTVWTRPLAEFRERFSECPSHPKPKPPPPSEHALSRLAARVEVLERKVQHMGTQLEDLTTEVAGLKADVAAEQARVKAHEDSDAAQITALNQTVANLEAAIAQGTTPDLAGILSDVKAIRASVQSNDPAPAAAVTTP